MPGKDLSNLNLQAMHLLSISLVTIFAGTLLLAKFRKEQSGKFFRFISWFFIVVGFMLFVGFIAGGICRMSHHRCMGPPGCQHEMMTKHGGPGMKDGCCSPGGMEAGMCPKGHGCLPGDSMMKCCPRDAMKCDSMKMALPKK